MLAMIVLCVGVFLASWTRTVTADQYTVNVRVPGPAPAIPATIDSPITGSNFQGSDLPIAAKGTCPANTYVALYRNNVFSGVVLCDVDNKWEITTTLFPGTNQLIARDYSMTDVPGPDSNLVIVTYVLPYTPPPTGGGTSSSSGSSGSGGSRSTRIYTNPLLLKADYQIHGYYINTPAPLGFNLSGGTAPYAVNVEWGDSKHDLIIRQREGNISLTHTYKDAGEYRGSYVVKISVSDADGNTSYLQLMSIINNPPDSAKASSTIGGVIPGITDSPNGLFSGLHSDEFGRLVKFVWPSYAMVVLMLVSFWLGERREYLYLKPRLQKSRRL